MQAEWVKTHEGGIGLRHSFVGHNFVSDHRSPELSSKMKQMLAHLLMWPSR
jgi:hypothetical protein